MTDTLAEIKDILDFVMKSHFIPPEDIEVSVNNFKMAFLTLENKEEFLPFLQNYSREAEKSDDYDRERITFLQNELERFYDRIPDMFSLHHIGGYKDPNDKEESGNLSKDIDDSFDFLKQHTLNQNLFGPEIPENLKPTVIKVLEKISTFHDQKVANRVELISRWRILRLADKTEKIRQQVPALLTIQKHMRKKFNGFYSLRAFARRVGESTSSLPENGFTAVPKALEEELQQLRAEVAAFRARASQNGGSVQTEQTSVSSVLLGAGVEREMLELAAKLKERDGTIRSLTEQLREATEVNFSRIQQSNEAQDDELANFKERINELESQVIALNHDNISKDAKLREEYKVLSDMREALERVNKEVKSYKFERQKNSLNALGKVRFLAKALKIFTARLQGFAFYRLQKRSERKLTALNNVADRVRARILVQTRLLNCGQDMRRSFLRWLVKSDPDLLRETFSKLVITAKISHQVAIWRLKKLVFKPMHTKLPEAVKAVRRLKAFFFLSEMYSHRGMMEKKWFINKLNPNYRTRGEALLERVFVEKNRQRVAQASKLVLRTLRNKTNIERRALSRIIENYSSMLQIGFYALRLKNRHRNNLAYLVRLLSGVEKLRALARQRKRQLFTRIRPGKNDFFKSLMDRLATKGRLKLTKAFARLRENLSHFRSVRVEEGFRKQHEQVRTAGFVTRLSDRNDWKLRAVVARLRGFNRTQNQLQSDRMRKLKVVFGRLADVKALIQGQTLEALAKHKNRLLAAKLKQRRLLKQAINAVLAKQRIALRKLADNKSGLMNRHLAVTFQHRKMFLALLVSALGKKRLALNRLRTNRTTMLIQQSTGQTKLFSNLKRATNMIMSNTLKRLSANVEDARGVERQNMRKSIAVKRLMMAAFRKQFAAIEQLRANAVAVKLHQKLSQGRINRLVQRLAQAVNLKRSSAVDKLKANNAASKIQAANKTRMVRALASDLNSKSNDKARESLRRLVHCLAHNTTLSKDRNQLLARLFLRLGSRYNLLRRDTMKRLERNRANRQLAGFTSEHKLRQLTKRLQAACNYKQIRCVEALRVLIAGARAKNDKDARLRKLLASRLSRASEGVKQRVVDSLRAHRLKTSLRQSTLSKLHTNFLSYLKRSHQKQTEALAVLRHANAAANQRERLLALKKRMAILRIFFPSTWKAKTALDCLRLNGRLSGLNDQTEELRRRFEANLARRKRTGLLYLLVASLDAKCSASLFKLMRFAKERKLEEARRRERLHHKLQRVMEALQDKLGNAFTKLLRHRDARRKVDEENAARKAKMRQVLGAEAKPLYDSTKLSSILQQVKGLADSPNDDPFFKAIGEQIKAINADGRFDELLRKINNGSVSNLEDLYRFATRSNSNGQFDPILALIDANHADMSQVLRFARLSNFDGRYSDIIQSLEKNPRLGTVDVLELIARSAEPQKLEALRKFIEGHRRLDDLMLLMRAANQDGQYDKPLLYLKKLENPRLTDLMQFLERNPDRAFDDLRRAINAEAEGDPARELISFMKNNNANGQFTETLNAVKKLNNPKLSDIFAIISQGGLAGQAEEILCLINGEDRNPAKKFLGLLERHNDDGAFDDLLSMFRLKPSMRLTEMCDYILVANHDGKLGRAIALLNQPSNFEIYKDFVQRTNKDGAFDDLLAFMAAQSNLQFTDIIRFARNNNDEGRFDSLLQKITRSEPSRLLVGHLKATNRNQQLNPLIQLLETNKSASILDAIDFMSVNNKDGRYDNALRFINGVFEPTIFDSVVAFTHRENGEGLYTELLAELAKIERPGLTSLYAAVMKLNSKGQFNNLVDMINGEAQRKIDRLFGFARNNNADGRHDDFIRHMEGLADPQLTDVLEFIVANNKNGKLDDLRDLADGCGPSNLLDDAIAFMQRNNSSGKYEEVLFEIRRLQKPTLTDFVRLLKTKNSNGQYNEVLAIINEEDKAAEIQEIINFMNANNQSGLYTELLEQLKLKKNPKLTDILAYAFAHNEDRRFDPLLERIGNPYISNSKMLRFMTRHNADGRYTELMEILQKSPNTLLTQTLARITQEGAEHRYEELRRFVNNGGVEAVSRSDDGADDLFKFLANSRRKKDFPELFEYLEKNKIDDPEALLEYLRKHNTNGRYDELIAKITSLLKPADGVKMARTRFSLLRPLGEKMRACLARLREVNRQLKFKDRHHADLLRELLNKLALELKMRKASCLARLVMNKNDQSSTQTRRSSKLLTLFRKIREGERAKLSNCLQSLRQQNRTLKEQELKRSAAVGKMGSVLFRSSQKKLLSSVGQLSSHKEETNRRLKAFFSKVLEAVKHSKENTLHALVLHKKLADLKNSRIRKTLARLLLQTRQRLMKHLSLLKLHKDSCVIRDRNRLAKLTKVTNKLGSSGFAVLRDVLGVLKEHAQTRSSRSSAESRRTKFLLRSLVSGGQAKLNQSFNRLTLHKSNKAWKNLEFRHKIQRMLDMLVSKRRVTLKNPLSTLMSYKNQQAKETLDRLRSNSAIQLLVSKTQNATTLSAHSTLSRLRLNAIETSSSQKSRTNRLKALFASLKSKSNAKMLKVVKKLKDLAAEARAQNLKRQQATILLTRSLKASADQSSKTTLSSLQLAKERLVRSSERNNAKLAGLLNKLSLKTKLKTTFTLSQLRNANQARRIAGANRDGRLRKLFDRLAAANKGFLATVVRKLRTHRLHDKTRSERALMLKRRLLAALATKGKATARAALQELRQNRTAKNLTHHLKQSALQKILGRLGRGKVHTCFEKLIVNYLQSRLRRAKVSRTIARMNTAGQFKALRSLGQLRTMEVAQRLLGQLRALALNASVSRLALQRRSTALLSLKDFIKHQVLGRASAVRTIRRHVLLSQASFWRRLKLSNFLFKRNHTNNTISSLMLGLRKNHRTNIRHALDIWSRKALKNKLHAFNGLIAGFFFKQTSFAYEKIKKDYLLKKYRKLIGGILNLVSLVEEKEKERKKWAMKIIISRFVDNNPWLRKVVNIMAVYSKPNEQIAFWRMRFAKNLKAEGISAEQRLALKRLEGMLKKHIVLALSPAFYNIQNRMER